MKIFIAIIVSFAIPYKLLSQNDFQTLNGALVFDTTVSMPNATAKQLYRQALIWFNQDFPQINAKVNPIETDGLSILGTNKFYTKIPVYRNLGGYIDYSILVEFKDDKYKFYLKTEKYWYALDGTTYLLADLENQNKKVHKDAKIIIMGFFKALSNNFHYSIASALNSKNW